MRFSTDFSSYLSMCSICVVDAFMHDSHVSNLDLPLYVFFIFIFIFLYFHLSIILRLSEPVGSARPKFPMTDTSRTYTVSRGSKQTLFCPAQAFPVPAFRYQTIDFIARLHFYFCAKERKALPKRGDLCFSDRYYQNPLTVLSQKFR